MAIPEEARATAVDLSEAASKFLDYVAAHPDAARRLDYAAADLPAWVQLYTYKLQTWPVLVDRRKLEEIERATIAITKLFRSVPERIFDGDPRRISSFYGVNEDWVTLILEPPSGIESSLARCDLVDSDTGLKCVEVNLSANLGGWQLRFFEEVCRRNPSIARFFEREGIAPRHRDPWRILFHHVAEESRRAAICEGGELNTALVVDSWLLPATEESTRSLNEVYSAALRSNGASPCGKLVLCSYPDGLTGKGGRLYHGDTQVHAVVEYTQEVTSASVYRCFKADKICLFNGPLSQFMGSKRVLALLSEHEGSARFSDDERALIRAHIPWSRDVTAGETTFRGEATSLLDLLVARQGEFVLKPNLGSQGEGVYVGRSTAPEEWEQCVRSAAANGGWVVQEHIDSRPYLYQAGEAGSDLHDTVWGTFCFGDIYGGGFLRIMPRGRGSGVINAARGAALAFIFEV
ncbi:MAG TPA: hypothetical protein VN783_07805 [Thermoanaerobaculia bacterium]|nr:hypothetical protein [Thermoanaerobaculia bacterium]